MTRGKKALKDRELFLLRKVREARAALDSVDDEIAYKVEELTRILRGEAETEVRAQVWAALDAGISMAEVKSALKIKNHDSFKKLYLGAYVAPEEIDYDTAYGEPDLQFSVYHDNVDRVGHRATWHFFATVTKFRRFALNLTVDMYGTVISDPWEGNEEEFLGFLDSDATLAAEWSEALDTIKKAIEREAYSL